MASLYSLSSQSPCRLPGPRTVPEREETHPFLMFFCIDQSGMGPFTDMSPGLPPRCLTRCTAGNRLPVQQSLSRHPPTASLSGGASNVYAQVIVPPQSSHALLRTSALELFVPTFQLANCSLLLPQPASSASTTRPRSHRTDPRTASSALSAAAVPCSPCPGASFCS